MRRQMEIGTALRKAGFKVTQSTVSRETPCGRLRIGGHLPFCDSGPRRYTVGVGKIGPRNSRDRARSSSFRRLRRLRETPAGRLYICFAGTTVCAVANECRDALRASPDRRTPAVLRFRSAAVYRGGGGDRPAEFA
jgi:Arginine repressor, DNA binding domain